MPSSGCRGYHGSRSMRRFMINRFFIYFMLLILPACSKPDTKKIERDFDSLKLKEIQRISVNENPKNLIFKRYKNNLFIASTDNNTLQRYRIDENGSLYLVLSKVIPEGKGPGELFGSGSVEIDSNGNIFIIGKDLLRITCFNQNFDFIDTTYINETVSNIMVGYQSSALLEDRYLIFAVVPLEIKSNEFFVYDIHTNAIVDNFGREIMVEEPKSAQSLLDDIIPIMGVFSQCGKTLYRMTFEPRIYLYRDFQLLKTLDLNTLFSEYGYTFTPPVKGKIKSSPGYISNYYMNVNKTRKAPYLCFYDSAGNRLLLTVFDESGNICKKYRIEGAPFTFYGEEQDKDILVYWYDDVLIFRKGQELVLYKIVEEQE